MPAWRGFSTDRVISSSCRDLPSSSSGYAVDPNVSLTSKHAGKDSFSWLGGLARFRRRRQDGGRCSVSADAEFTRSTADVNNQLVLEREVAMKKGTRLPLTTDLHIVKMVNDQNTVPQAELADEITEDDNDNLGLRNSRPRDISSALESHISSHTTSHPSLNDPMRPFSLPNRESSIDLEVNNLRSEVKKLREELLSCKENVKHLQQKEIQLQDRLSKQAQKQFSRGPTKFEDLSIGAQRPSELIRSFGDIYTESRVDAFDSLDEITQLQGFDDLKCKLLFSIVVLSFRSVEREIATMKQQIRDVLNNYTNPMFLSRDSSSDCNNDSNDEDYNSNNKNTLSSGESINTDPLECFITEFEPLVNDYLFESVGQHRHDITKNIEEVSTQICLTLYDYPELRQNDGLALYIEEIVRLAWSLSVQKPALTIVYDFSEFDPDVHKRFHSSNPEQDIIQAVLWPALREHNGTKIVHKAIVVT